MTKAMLTMLCLLLAPAVFLAGCDTNHSLCAPFQSKVASAPLLTVQFCPGVDTSTASKFFLNILPNLVDPACGVTVCSDSGSASSAASQATGKPTQCKTLGTTLADVHANEPSGCDVPHCGLGGTASFWACNLPSSLVPPDLWMQLGITSPAPCGVWFCAVGQQDALNLAQMLVPGTPGVQCKPLPSLALNKLGRQPLVGRGVRDEGRPAEVRAPRRGLPGHAPPDRPRVLPGPRDREHALVGGPADL